MLIVIRRDFDSSENHNPVHTRILGWVPDRAAADALVRQTPATPYRGWDGRKYPIFEVVELPRAGEGAPYDMGRS